MALSHFFISNAALSFTTTIAALALALTATPAAGSEEPKTLGILRRAAQDAVQLPEEWPADATMAKLRVMQETADKYKSIQEIATAQAEAGDIEGALKSTESLRIQALPVAKQSEVLKFPCLLAIATAQAKAGDRAGGVATLRRASGILDDPKNQATHPGYLKNLALAQARIGERVAAVATARRLLKAALVLPIASLLNENERTNQMDRVGALIFAASAFEAAGEHEAAEDARLAARRAVETEPERPLPADLKKGLPGFQAEGLARLVRARCDDGDFPGALRLFGEIEGKLREADDGKSRNGNGFAMAEGLLAEIAVRQALTDWAGALHTLDSMEDAAQRAIAVTMIVNPIVVDRPKAIDWPAVVNRLRRAIPAIDAERDPSPLAQAFIGLARAEGEAGERAAALATIQRFETLVLGHWGPSTEVGYLCTIAGTLGRIGDRAAAIETLRRARRLVESEKHDTDRIFLLTIVATAQADLGDGDWAMGTLASIPPQYVQSRNGAAKAIALARAKAGDLPGVLRARNAMAEDPKDPRALLRIAEEVAEEVAFERAKAGEVQWALDWAEGQKIPLAKVRALIGAARGLSARRGEGEARPANP